MFAYGVYGLAILCVVYHKGKCVLVVCTYGVYYTSVHVDTLYLLLMNWTLCIVVFPTLFQSYMCRLHVICP